MPGGLSPKASLQKPNTKKKNKVQKINYHIKWDFYNKSSVDTLSDKL